MEFAYTYSAKNSRGQLLKGVVHAKSKAFAFSKLKKGGFLPLSVKLNAGASLGGIFRPGFNQAELARFYITLGRRLGNGKSLVEGLEAATEYVQDQRLRQAVMLMRQSTLDGQSEFQSMQVAGFPNRDCLVIRSTSETGKTGESFIALGEEIARVASLRKAVASTFRMPAIMAVFMVIFIWAALMFIAPATLSFLKQTGLKLNFSPLIGGYFSLVKLFHKQAIVSSIIYFAIFIGIGFFLKSKVFKDFLDRFKTLKTLALKSDHATLWNSFSLLYDAAVPAKEAAAIVGDSARREDSKVSFVRMGRLIESGRTLEDAASSANFPPFIVSGVASAASGGDMVTGLNDMVSNLEEDVRVLTDLMQENAKILSVVAMGCGILLVFVMTYYPMLASVMSNL